MNIKTAAILGFVWIAMLVLNGCSEYSDVERFTTDLTPTTVGIKGAASECLVVIEVNESGRERAYVQTATSKTWVSPEWVRAILLD